MAADFTIKQGDSEPVLTDTLTYSDGSAVDLSGATLELVVRSMTEAEPRALSGSAQVTDAPAGAVSYTFSAADTATAGLCMATWVVTFPGGAQMTFPTVGYLWLSIEENLSVVGGAQLVSLPDVKDYLNLAPSDRDHDARILRFISSVRPVVERITGPILLTTFDEWHRGGHTFVQLRRRASSTFGTTPVMELLTCTEFRGAATYELDVVADPAHGSAYSCMVDAIGTVTRRSAGGGVMAFPPGPDTVHVTYRAGQSAVPENVYEGTLELIRLNYQHAVQSGRARALRDDDDLPTGPAVGFFVPNRVRELLGPNRRAPSVA